MSTVLTNGIIIPENGSRNWGGDLANNWNIIDVNVGYMTDVKNRVTTLESSVAENTANIQTNASNISALQTSKQDVIEDLETIRTGASAGATAVQPSALNNYVDLSSNQMINGVKNFNDVVVGEQSGLIRIGNNGEGNHFCTLNYDGVLYDILKQFVPQTNNEYNLGTSTNKWKTLNGINPGALSLPKYDMYVTLTFQLNTQIQATFTGFLQVKANVSNGAYLIVTINNLQVGVDSPSASTANILVPVNKDDQIYVTVTNGDYLGYGSLFIFQAQGNV